MSSVAGPTPSTKLARLEELRGAASFYVFVHHYVRHNLPEATYVARFFVFGQAAVLLFFVLSGFVIHYSALRRTTFSPRAYFIRRFLRIYPVFAVALLFSYVAACVRAEVVLDPEVPELVLNLAQLQGLERTSGVWASPYMENEPLWSLSFEWWFYMMFCGVFVFAPPTGAGRRRFALAISIVGFIIDVACPNPLSLIGSYFVIWWIGAELGRQWFEQGRVTLRAQRESIAGAGVIALGWVALASLHATQGEMLDLYRHPGLTARHFCTALLLVGAGLALARWGGRRPEVLLRPFGLVAPFSYALYVLHLPFIQLAAELGSSGYGSVDFLWITPTLFAFCWAVEQPVQRWIAGSKASAPAPATRT